MPIWSNPSDRFYEGPATYRLIVYGRNYCGKTFYFKKRVYKHKSSAKCWEEQLARGKNIQEVHKTIDTNWDDVVIEIIARYPDKIKGVEADEDFMNEREIEAIAFYNSFHNGLNMAPGGYLMSDAEKKKLSQRMMGKQIALGYRHTEETKANMSRQRIGNNFALGAKHTPEQNQAQSLRMIGHTNNDHLRKSVTAKKGDKIWNFVSAKKASILLTQELGKTFHYAPVKQAASGKYCTNKHVYKGITFKYD